ncbi:MAG: EAL domain-containing protein, partial [Pseudomonadota bacterium]
ASEQQLEQKNLQLTHINEVLGRSETRFRELADMLPMFVCETDIEGMITYANQKLLQNFGYDHQQLEAGIHLSALFIPPDHARVSESWGNIWLNGEIDEGLEYEVLFKDDEVVPVLLYSEPMRDKANNEINGIRIAFADITRYKKQEEQIIHQAYFDSLTNLPNRRLILDRLDLLIKQANRANDLIAVIFIDLDDFKKVNDTLGHDIGDLLLIEVAKRLQESIRGHDTIGRLGGDEFILLLSNLTQATDAKSIADNILYRFRKPLNLQGRELFITTSFGIAIYPDNGETSSELLRKADTAMYHAKAQGRNTYRYYTDEMNKDVSRRFLIEEQLYGALTRGELYLRYQPVIQLDNLQIIGVEALLRWHNPVLGEMSPEEFVPIAEQTGLIVPIGRYVLSEAFLNLAQWQGTYHQMFRLAVNISPRQFRDRELIPYIKETIEKTGISNESLDLEITEGVLMSGQSFIEEALADLNNLGIGISMDDFGTGYSSLSYLRKYPFNMLKIDKSFMHDLGENSANGELVNAAIAMAHGLGLKVIAEGVEDKMQADYLASQACDFAQGYLFGKPMSSDNITELLKAQSSTP